MENSTELLKKAPGAILRYSGVIVLMVAAIMVYRWFEPSKTVSVDKPVPVRDQVAIAQAVKETKDIADDSIATLWDKISGLQKRVAPTGSYGTPVHDPLPPRELKIQGKDSTQFTLIEVPAYDAPISFVADRSSIRITTRNQYNYAKGEPYIKVYNWPRLARDLSFALLPTTNYDRLDGINLMFNKRAFEFDGFGLIAGVGYPERFYAGVDARFIFWESLELTPRLLTTPELVLEARWRF